MNKDYDDPAYFGVNYRAIENCFPRSLCIRQAAQTTLIDLWQK